MNDRSNIKIACVGDSLTFGYLICNRKKNSYPARLQSKLGESYQVENFGLNGATISSYQTSEPFLQALAFNPDWIVCFLGANDSCPGAWQGGEAFYQHYVTLLRNFKEQANRLFYLVLLPQVAENNNFRVQNKIIVEEINPVIQKLSEEFLTGLLDLTDTFESKDFQSDGVHFNDLGAGKCADTIAAQLIFHSQLNEL